MSQRIVLYFIFCLPCMCSALELEGQVILGVFVPAIVLVLVITVVRICWQLHYAPNLDPPPQLNRYPMLMIEFEQAFLEPPRCPGHVYTTETDIEYHYQLLEQTYFIQRSSVNYFNGKCTRKYRKRRNEPKPKPKRKPPPQRRERTKSLNTCRRRIHDNKKYRYYRNRPNTRCKRPSPLRKLSKMFVTCEPETNFHPAFSNTCSVKRRDTKIWLADKKMNRRVDHNLIRKINSNKWGKVDKEMNNANNVIFTVRDHYNNKNERFTSENSFRQRVQYHRLNKNGILAKSYATWNAPRFGYAAFRNTRPLTSRVNTVFNDFRVNRKLSRRVTKWNKNTPRNDVKSCLEKFHRHCVSRANVLNQSDTDKILSWEKSAKSTAKERREKMRQSAHKHIN